ncbi:MAG: alpha/beta fold hydrolase [Thermoanaerobaculia bacterium]|nr:alpha/beta fold hydrolase [Thermoanaerobaculia bacterium]
MTDFRPARGRAMTIATVAAWTALALVFGLLGGAAEGAKKKKKKTPEPTPVPRPQDPYRVTIPTSDGVALAGTFRPVDGNPNAPGVLLIHDFSRERREWEPFAGELHGLGFATLSFDLRAHGESTKKAGAKLAISPRLLRDPVGFPRDVAAAAAWLRTKAPKTAAVGLSAGGYLALLASSRGQVDAAVALSVNESRVVPLAGGAPVTPKGALLLACTKDPGRADSAKNLLAASAEPKRMLLFPGGSHNLAVLREHPEAKTATLAWLAERLGAPAPAAPAPSTQPAAVPK